jgi:hypothetical protein
MTRLHTIAGPLISTLGADGGVPLGTLLVDALN